MARRRRPFIPFVMAAVAGAAGGAAFMQFAKQRQVAASKLRANSTIIDTALGPVEFTEAGSGPVVLALHGVIAGYDQGFAIAAPLVEAGYRVVAISRPGYLRTPLIEDMSPSGQADLYAAFLDAMKIKEAAILGISGGGPSAVMFAAHYPDRCKALIMMCAVSQAMEVHEEELSALNQMFIAARDSDFLMWLTVHLALRTLPLQAIQRPELRSQLLNHPARMRMYSRVFWGVFPVTLRRTGTAYDEGYVRAMPKLPFKQVTAPTLVLHGTADMLVPPEHARNTAHQIAGARLILVEGGEHAFFVPYYDEVWPEVERFLGEALKPAQKPKPAAKPVARKPAASKSAAKPKAIPKPAPRRRPTPRKTSP
jgi:pimeloyl-ACP methyl ester carboxylesterase